MMHHNLQVGLNCYPNPFRDGIFISINTKSPNISKIEIYDSEGRMFKEIHRGFLDIGKYDFFLSAEAMQPNIYFVVLSNENERLTKKIVLLE
jgi:hypothetical protein